ncbi:prepilin-type N-terminal cleavage/methylation domain-containing protein [Vibrio scophthalmi]
MKRARLGFTLIELVVVITSTIKMVGYALCLNHVKHQVNVAI